MSNENAELIRRAYEAYANGDLAAMLELVDPDLEWTYLDPALEQPTPQVCHGRRSRSAIGRVIGTSIEPQNCPATCWMGVVPITAQAIFGGCARDRIRVRRHLPHEPAAAVTRRRSRTPYWWDGGDGGESLSAAHGLTLPRREEEA
jgi:hypothetical protein